MSDRPNRPEGNQPDRPDDAAPGRPDDADIEATLRDMAPEDLELLAPPPSVWEGITSALETPDASVAPNATDTPDTPGRPNAADAVVVPLESRSRSRWRIAVPSAAAAAVLVIVGIALYSATQDDPEVIATAALAYDAEAFDPLGAQASANADLVAEGRQHRIQLVDASLPPAGPDADLEAWLIQPDEQGNVADLVSLGLVDPADPGDPGSLAVPAGYDPALYTVVDISVEPRDGDPSHSGRSILRGALRAP